MTFREALANHYVAGFVLRRQRPAADGIYLSDYRKSAITHTSDEGEAEFFLRLIDADEMARRLRHVTGYRYEVETVGTTVPGPAPKCCKGERLCEPCRVEDAAEGEYHWPEDEAVGRQRVRLSDGRTLDVTVDELALSGAREDFDDAVRGFHLPIDAPMHLFDNEVN